MFAGFLDTSLGNRLYSLKLAQYIFVRHVIFNKVVTCRLEACDFAKKCFEKISRRKFPNNLKGATAHSPCRKTWSPFNETAGTNSRPAALVKKKPPLRRFTCEYNLYSASTGRSYIGSTF